MQQFLVDLGKQHRYWAALILIGLALEGGALFYQYVLDEWPCVLCIHVRILVMAFVLLAMVAIFCTGSVAAMRFFHGINSLLMAWLVERSWQVLAVERGWIFGDCGLMSLGMPVMVCARQMVAVGVRGAKQPVATRPLILFNITMAESLACNFSVFC